MINWDIKLDHFEKMGEKEIKKLKIFNDKNTLD